MGDFTQPAGRMVVSAGRRVACVPTAVLDELRETQRIPVCAYVYDRAVARNRAAQVRASLPAGAELYYAVKANGHPCLIEALLSHVDGLEVSSAGELDKATQAGARRVVFSGPAKTDAELMSALRQYATSDQGPWRLMINAESHHELRRINFLATALGVVAHVTLRVNRKHCPIRASLQMSGAATPFGIDEDHLGQVIDEARRLDAIRLHGFHLHAVSNNLDATTHAAFVKDSVAWSKSMAAKFRIPLEIINLGGGLGIDYAGRESFNLEAFAAMLSPTPKGARLLFELGRYLVAEAGWYAAEVIDVKSNHGKFFAAIRGGTHHFRLPAAWGYSHPFLVLPVEQWPYPFPRPGAIRTPITIAGELCTSRDVLCRDQWVDNLRVGDVVAFDRVGAYGLDASHHDFLSHDKPEIIVR